MLKYHIQTIDVGAGGAGSISFSSIPADYTDLVLVTSLRSSTNQAWAKLQINGSDSDFSSRSLEGYGTDGTFSFSRSDNLNFIAMNNGAWTANTFSNQSTYFPNYRSSAAKSISLDMVSENNAGSGFTHIMAKLWNNSSAITSLTIVPQSGTLVEHSSASLYGIKRGSDGKTETASGGAISFSGGYTIHTFQSSGTFVANRDLDVEYLVVAGGGGGANPVINESTTGGGGGGAGGYRCSVQGESSGGGAAAESAFRVNSGDSYSVIVGAGGTGNSGVDQGAPGSSSSFSSISTVGGGGGGRQSRSGAAGGSGGGGSVQGAFGGAGTAGQGFAGGNGAPTFLVSGAGGGGGGAVGQTVSTSAGANGGMGATSAITGTSVQRAGGGGGGGTTGGSATGGGGAGSSTTSGNNGQPNTGGGAGGIRGNATGRNGGSGIVIIRYLTPA